MDTVEIKPQGHPGEELIRTVTGRHWSYDQAVNWMETGSWFKNAGEAITRMKKFLRKAERINVPAPWVEEVHTMLLSREVAVAFRLGDRHLTVCLTPAGWEVMCSVMTPEGLQPVMLGESQLFFAKYSDPSFKNLHHVVHCYLHTGVCALERGPELCKPKCGCKGCRG